MFGNRYGDWLVDGATGVDEGRDLEALLGFQIQMAHMLMIGAARDALEPFDMTPARLAALLLIRSNPGCDQSALGRALGVNRSSAMKLVNLLIQRDLIERRPGRDMRSHALYVKPAGETRLARMIAAVRCTEDFPEDALSAAERDMLVGLLRKLRVAMAGSAEDVGEAL